MRLEFGVVALVEDAELDFAATGEKVGEAVLGFEVDEGVFLLVLLASNDSEGSVDGDLRVDIATPVSEVILTLKWLATVVRVTIELELTFCVELGSLI
jgi:hypothetical protein